MKKLLCSILGGILAFSGMKALAMPYFTGYTGILADFTAKAKENSDALINIDPVMESQAFFAGQLDFSGKVLVRGEFYLRTGDLLKDSIFVDSGEYNADFRIEEFSGTWVNARPSSTHFLSLFMGSFEPIGSDVFLRRYFSIQPQTSLFTRSWRGINGASMYNVYGAGISYVLRFDRPHAAGLNVYFNQLENDDGMFTNVLTADGRYACVFPNFTLDVSAGVGIPMETTDDSGSNVIAVVRTINLHAGLSMLAGNRYTSSFFMQAGFGSLILNPSAQVSTTGKKYNAINFEDLYILLEPRIGFRQFQLNVALFNIPGESMRNMIYLSSMYDSGTSNVLGLNISAVTDMLYLKNTNFTFGIHTTAAIKNPLEGFSGDIKFSEYMAQSLQDILLNRTNINITPFVSVPVFGGMLSSSMSIRIMQFASEWQRAIKLSVGFKTQI